MRAADVDNALRSAADALACDAVGAVVLEVWGEARQLDLVASRKLTLSAQASGVSCLVLRIAAAAAAFDRGNKMDRAGGALAAGADAGNAWGAPVFDAQLVRTVTARSGDGSWNGNVMSAFSANPRRILSLWLPRLPIDRIRRQLRVQRRAG